MLCFSRLAIHLLLLWLPLGLAGCALPPSDGSAPPALLTQVNAMINRAAHPCPRDVCLEDWPDPTTLAQLETWDCKAYAVAKADRLIRRHAYHPERLEYILVEGAPLRVTHAALLVDGRWVLDSGLRCQQVCELPSFVSGLRLTGRLAVSDLAYLQRAAAQSR